MDRYRTWCASICLPPYENSLTRPEMFSTLCTVQADLSQMTKTLKPRRGRKGVQFYQQDYDVVLLFGLTELKAYISWMDNVRALYFALWVLY
jgi:hypothetical protein